MNEDQEKQMIEDYGITNPKPVIEKFKKADERFESVVDKQLTELSNEIQQSKVLKKGEDFLKDHPKK